MHKSIQIQKKNIVFHASFTFFFAYYNIWNGDKYHYNNGYVTHALMRTISRYVSNGNYTRYMNKSYKCVGPRDHIIPLILNKLSEEMMYMSHCWCKYTVNSLELT